MVLLDEGHGATALKHEAATKRITLSPLKLPRLGANLRHRSPPPATGGTGWLPPYRPTALPPFATAFK